MEPDRLYTKAFFIALIYNFLIALNFTNNAIYPLYITQVGGSAAIVGLFIGVYSLAAFLGKPVIGPLIDRFGIQPILIFGSLCIALPPIGYLVFLDQGLHPLIWVLRIIQGFGFGAHFTAFFTLAARTAPYGRRNESIAMYGISGLAGNLIGPVLGEWLTATQGLAIFFIVMTLIGLGGTISALFLRTTGRKKSKGFSLRTLTAALKTRELRFPLILAPLLSMSFAAPVIFLAPLATARGLQGFSLYFTGFAVAGITIRLIGKKWGDQIGWRRILIPSFIIYAAGLWLIFFSPNLLILGIAGFLSGNAQGLAFPAVTSLGYTLAPEDAKGSAMALITGTMDLGVFITGIILGMIADRAGYGIIFPVASIAPLIGAFLVIINVLKYPGRFSARFAENIPRVVGFRSLPR